MASTPTELSSRSTPPPAVLSGGSAALAAGLAVGTGVGVFLSLPTILGSIFGKNKPSSTNIAGGAINELSRQLGLGVFKFQGKGQTAGRNRASAGRVSRRLGFPLNLPRDAFSAAVPGIREEASRRAGILTANPLLLFKPESLKGKQGRQLTGAKRRNAAAKASLVLNIRQFNEGFKGGKGTGKPKVTNPVNTQAIIGQIFNEFIGASRTPDIFIKSPTETPVPTLKSLTPTAPTVPISTATLQTTSTPTSQTQTITESSRSRLLALNKKGVIGRKQILV